MSSGKQRTLAHAFNSEPETVNQREIARLEQGLPRIDHVASFRYGTGSDYPKGVLGHDDVLRISTQFLVERKPRMIAMRL